MHHRFSTPFLLLVGLVTGCSPSETSGQGPSDVVPIYAVQGAGTTSPLEGQEVVVRGIVTGDFQRGDGDSQSDLGGFYLQEELSDDNPLTSDGVFVFEDDLIADVNVGDRVRVAGTVAEFFGETQIAARVVDIVGEGSIAPTVLPVPATVVTRNEDGALIADFEPYEGMFVRIDAPLAIVDAGEISRFGALQLAAGEAPQQFTNVNRPDARRYAQHREQTARATLFLDDGRRSADVSPPRYLFATESGAAVRLGDRVAYAAGNLRFSRGAGNSGFETFRLMPVGAPRFASSEPRPEVPRDVGGTLKVMSLNALNYFTTLDSGRPACGPQRDLGCRGANTERERLRQRDKLVTAIRIAAPDIVALMEIENNDSGSLASLVDTLNAEGGSWAFVPSGTVGNDAIKVGMLYEQRTVEMLRDHAVLDGSVDSRFNSEKNRPALAQTFRAIDNGGVLTVVVNHLKSKGSDCDELGDPNRRDGQGNCNRTRTAAAQALAEWLAQDPTGSGDDDVLIVGDLNAYRREDPIEMLRDNGFVLLGDSASGPAYSFVFRGERGALDHALSSPSLANQIAGVTEWHINADELRELDYNLESRDPAWFSAATPFRASDHDPLIVGIDINAD